MASQPLASAVPPAPARIRAITEADLRWALAEGWNDFKDKRGDLLIVAVIYPVLGFLSAMLVLNDQLLPLFFPLVAGLSIFGPAVASGFYELARRREEGLDSTWWHFLDPLQGRGREELGLLTGGLAILFLAWLITAWAIYSATIGQQNPTGIGGFVYDLFNTAAGWRMILLGNLAGLVFAVVALVFATVSFPMVVDKAVDARTAVTASVAAFRANPRVMASWGLRVALILALGCIPLFVGLAVALPVLGYATWHLYTRLIER